MFQMPFPQAQRQDLTNTMPVPVPRRRIFLAVSLLVALLAMLPAAGSAMAECDPDTVDVKVYSKACGPTEDLGQGDCIPLALQPNDSIQGRQPVLFVHGHNLSEKPGEYHFRRNWQEKQQYLLYQLPSFRDALVDGSNSHLSLEPYYVHFEDQHRSIADDACAIAGAVRRILRRHGDPDAGSVKVAIIANSKGTISSRLYLKSLEEQVDGFPAPEIAPENRFRPVSEFVAIATPNHGLALDPTVYTNLYCSRALRQLNDGFGESCKKPICRPSGSSCDLFHPACVCNTDCEPDSVGFFRALNGEDEAPGSRAPCAPRSEGILYLTLYADQRRDIAGGSGGFDACRERRRAENLSDHAVNVEVPEVLGKDIGWLVHANTVHTPEVICKALYTVTHHLPPPEFPCGVLNATTIPEIPSKPVVKAADVVLLLDTSGSMGWHATGSDYDFKGGCCSRLASAKHAAWYFVDQLGRFDTESRVGIATFSGRSGRSVYGLTGATDPEIHGKIGWEVSESWEEKTCPEPTDPPADLCPASCVDPIPPRKGKPCGIQAGGSTPMTAGLRTAHEMLTQAPDGEHRTRVVVLLSDGAHNVGLDPTEAPLDPGDPGGDRLLKGYRDSVIYVYTVGMGAGLDDWNEDMLRTISLDTQVAESTPDRPGFARFNLGDPVTEPTLYPLYDKILADLLSLQFTSDPSETISPGETQTHPLVVSDHDSLMSFTVSWESSRGALLDFEVVAPDCQTHRPQTSERGYQNLVLDGNALRAPVPGDRCDWQLRVSYPEGQAANQGATRPGPGTPRLTQIAYNYSVITRSTLELGVTLDQERPLTSDDLVIQARLTEEGRALPGGTVAVKVRRPELASGDWHFAHRVKERELDRLDDVISGETLSRLEKKTSILLARAADGKLELPPIMTEPRPLILEHQGNGVYTGALENLAVPGVWELQVVATGEASNGQSYHREWTVQKLVDMELNPATSDVEGAIEKARLGGSGILRVSVTPRDAAGNYLGPGYLDEIDIAITPAPKEDLGKEDLLYGAYQQRFEVADVTAEAKVVVTARGATLYDGPFSELRKPAYRWEVSGHVGYTEPHGLASATRSGDLSLMAGLGYRFSRSWSAELLLGHHGLSGKAATDDLDVLEVSVNSKYSVPLGVIRVFGNGGFGHYDPDTGGSGLGWNLGGGLIYPFSERSSLDLSYNYHKMTEGARLELSTVHLGYRWSF